MPKFAAFGGQWDVTFQRETSLRDAVLKAEAGAVSADRVLNNLADQATAAIHGGRKVDVELARHRLYFGSDTPYVLKRPILGTQLAKMRTWPELLSQETQANLTDLAAPVAAGVAAAKAAEDALHQAEVAHSKFRLGGERTQIFAAFNSLCATTHGELRALVHDHPELQLSADYPDSFFRHEQKNQGPQTIGQAELRLQKLKQELAKGQRAYDDLVAAQQAAETTAKAKAAASAAAKEAKKVAKEAIAKAKAAQAAAEKKR